MVGQAAASWSVTVWPMRSSRAIRRWACFFGVQAGEVVAAGGRCPAGLVIAGTESGPGREVPGGREHASRPRSRERLGTSRAGARGLGGGRLRRTEIPVFGDVELQHARI